MPGSTELRAGSVQEVAVAAELSAEGFDLNGASRLTPGGECVMKLAGFAPKSVSEGSESRNHGSGGGSGNVQDVTNSEWGQLCEGVESEDESEDLSGSFDLRHSGALKLSQVGLTEDIMCWLERKVEFGNYGSAWPPWLVIISLTWRSTCLASSSSSSSRDCRAASSSRLCARCSISNRRRTCHNNTVNRRE